MKLNNKFLGFALTAIAAGALVSCSNELNDPNYGSMQGLRLAKNPDVTAWSGKQVFGNDIVANNLTGTKAVGTRDTEEYRTLFGVKLENESPLVTVETTYLENCSWDHYTKDLPKPVEDNLPNEQLNLDKIESNFMVLDQQENVEFDMFPLAGNSNQSGDKIIGIFFYDNDKVRHNIVVWDNDQMYNGPDLTGKHIVVEKGVQFGFFWTGRTDKAKDNQNDTIYFSSKELNHPQKIKNHEDQATQIHAGLLKVNYLDENTSSNTYLCTEDWLDFDFNDFIIYFPNTTFKTVTTTPDDFPDAIEPTEDCPNIKKEVEDSGCDHPMSDHHWDREKNKWVCDTCEEGESECNPEESTQPEQPGQPGTDDKDCPKCGHTPNHTPGEGPCSECGPDDECYKECDECHHKWHGTPGTPTCPQCGEEDDCYITSQNPNVAKTSSEVEVNLSINDEHVYNNVGINDLVAKLSIHVRMAGDVQVVIPIGWDGTLDNDDLIVLNKHENGLLAHGGTKTNHVVTYNVGGQYAVTLRFEFNEENITITTEGITEEVFNYCRENFGDGINFEAYLYLNDKTTLTRETLKAALDQSTINFIDDVYPDYYINAFNDIPANPRGEKDCTVSIINEEDANQAGLYEDYKTGGHLNNGEYNHIFKRKDVKNDDEHYQHDHEFLWNYKPGSNAAGGADSSGSNTGGGE